MDWQSAVQIATLVAYLGGAILFVVMIKADIRVVKHDMRTLAQRQDILGEAFKQQGDILKSVAVQDTRLDRIEEDIREIRHGEGFVLPILKVRGPEK